jgi:PadR family transcriptional regulator PadR
MKTPTILVKGVAEVIILQILSAQGEAYGYQLIERIRQASAEVFTFREGTLYPLLYRLEHDGYVVSRRKVGENGKERRYYKITDKGQKQLVTKREEYLLFKGGMETVLTPATV